jgi:hypothetical protein
MGKLFLNFLVKKREGESVSDLIAQSTGDLVDRKKQVSVQIAAERPMDLHIGKPLI